MLINIQQETQLLQRNRVTFFIGVFCAQKPPAVGRSSPAVAERPHDASCLSVTSIQYVERKFRFRFSLRANKLCSVLFTSTSSSMLVVINKDSLVRGSVCDKLAARWTVAVQLQSAIDSQLFVDNSDFIRRPS